MLRVMSDAAKPPPEAPRPPRKKPGPPKGVRPAGRAKGTKNKATIEREKQAALAAERERMMEIAKLQGTPQAVVDAALAGKKMMKEIAFDFAYIFAGLASQYQPLTRGPDGISSVRNPNFNEAKFVEYAKLAANIALQAAPFESPKLAAVMLQSGMVKTIEVVGGLPDEEDGGFYVPDALAVAGDAAGSTTESGAGGAGNPGAGADNGAGKPPDVPPGAGPAVPPEGQAQGGPVR
jgi:hypothetical protein